MTILGHYALKFKKKGFASLCSWYLIIKILIKFLNNKTQCMCLHFLPTKSHICPQFYQLVTKSRHASFEYFPCIQGDVICMKVIKKYHILSFLSREGRFRSKPLRWFLCNTLTLPLFHYVCLSH